MVSIRQKIIDFKSENCDLSNSEIARKLGCSRMSVIRALGTVKHCDTATVAPIADTVTYITVAGVSGYRVPESGDEDDGQDDGDGCADPTPEMTEAERIKIAISVITEAANDYAFMSKSSCWAVIGQLTERLVRL